MARAPVEREGELLGGLLELGEAVVLRRLEERGGGEGVAGALALRLRAGRRVGGVRVGLGRLGGAGRGVGYTGRGWAGRRASGGWVENQHFGKEGSGCGGWEAARSRSIIHAHARSQGRRRHDTTEATARGEGETRSRGDRPRRGQRRRPG